MSQGERLFVYSEHVENSSNNVILTYIKDAQTHRSNLVFANPRDTDPSCLVTSQTRDHVCPFPCPRSGSVTYTGWEPAFTPPPGAGTSQ